MHDVYLGYRRMLAVVCSIQLLACGADSGGQDNVGAVQVQDSTAVEDSGNVVAVLEFEGSTVKFVREESVDGDEHVGYWVFGPLDLSSIEEQDATPLEVFLAVAAIGEESGQVPVELWEDHLRIAESSEVPDEPRDFSAQLQVSRFSSDGFDPEVDDGDGNCWGWGTATEYDVHMGYPNFSLSSFQHDFNEQYSQLSGAGVVSGSTMLSGRPGDVKTASTSYGHKRSMAICVARAVPQPGEEAVCQDGNLVRARAYIKYYTSSGAGPYCADCSGQNVLVGFGYGGRYRSAATSGGNARKYVAELEFLTPFGETSLARILCFDEVAVVWRSKFEGGFTL